MTISSAISKALPAAQNVRKWRPSLGHVYQLPTKQPQTKPKAHDSVASTPMPEGLGGRATAPAAATKNDDISMERVAEESLMVHMKYGGDYIDENPIAGRPGEFHLSSTGRKPVPPPQLGQPAGISSMNKLPSINTKTDEKKEGKEKTPKSATAPKVKRRKSKVGKGSATPSATTPAATTPAGS
jgi:mediator of RNA polymerase II transcription subunit 6